jgi:hypothetical protein
VDFWQADSRVMVSQPFNLTEGLEIAGDLLKDAIQFSRVHNNSIEIHNAEMVLGRTRRLVHQAKELVRGKRRVKRNFIGTLLHDIGGKNTIVGVGKKEVARGGARGRKKLRACAPRRAIIQPMLCRSCHGQQGHDGAPKGG